MEDKNIVEFGISQLHFGTYTVDAEGKVTLGTPYHLAGAVNLSMEADASENNFYADNVKYWSGYSDNGFTGTIEVAKFTDDFKTQFLGYLALEDGGIANVKGAKKPNVYIAFQSEGDAESRRAILYNVALGAISREYATVEENIEPTTESIGITIIGDNGTGLTMVAYGEDASGYATLFTNPPVPALPDVSA